MTQPRDVRRTGRTRAYWETTGAAHTFTHPLDPELLAAHLPVEGRILDYGCGYGRLVLELTERGYRDVRGVDPSAALVARGLADHPELRLTRLRELPLPFADASFDAALLFAVLTSDPDPVAQESAVAELARLVRPGGVVYVSDVPLQTDERSRARYRAQEASTGTYGVFRIEDGGTFQHQPLERFHELFGRHGFAVAEERRDVTPTLDGHTDLRVQLIVRRRTA
ncbi:class I SAM-dependent methyltransferase [Streptomyces varsoviensis]|uniref:class I SAM-dependent methyltransferase n=1 Tax=Streptomyces varsoviensis TaxID=67373 RepID=UPI0004C8D459|nr:class I SAM-dependent methyltransferase [Streptomyces varsoviensis]